jgi:hypothetical protein
VQLDILPCTSRSFCGGRSLQEDPRGTPAIFTGWHTVHAQADVNVTQPKVGKLRKTRSNASQVKVMFCMPRKLGTTCQAGPSSCQGHPAWLGLTSKGWPAAQDRISMPRKPKSACGASQVLQALARGRASSPGLLQNSTGCHIVQPPTKCRLPRLASCERQVNMPGRPRVWLG